MISVYPNLYVGADEDFEHVVKDMKGWAVVHADREPYHRILLEYDTEHPPKNHPEFFVALRNNRLFLNLNDPEDADNLPKVILDTALNFIHLSLLEGRRVLVHSSNGVNAAPVLALLYIASYSERFDGLMLADAESVYRKIYTAYKPNPTLRRFLRRYWQEYSQKE